MDANPILQFERWLKEILEWSELEDPTAMVLSTVDLTGRPDSRVVLLKGLNEEGFVFYSNYESNKGCQLVAHPFAALNFYWPAMARQVRIKGCVRRVDKATSDAYFTSRPLESQISAVVSPQSRPIISREYLDGAYETLLASAAQLLVPRPEHWGGYCLFPDEIEFWQGRDNRLHDRICYFRDALVWRSQRLAP